MKFDTVKQLVKTLFTPKLPPFDDYWISVAWLILWGAIFSLAGGLVVVVLAWLGPVMLVWILYALLVLAAFITPKMMEKQGKSDCDK